LAPFTHVTELRVRWPECDPAGIVYFANYLMYFELGTIEYLRARQASWGALRHRYGFVSAPRVEAHAQYRASARYDDLLAVHVQVADVAPKIITFGARIYLQPDERLIAEGHIKIALTGRDGRAAVLPPELVAWLHGDEPLPPAPDGTTVPVDWPRGVDRPPGGAPPSDPARAAPNAARMAADAARNQPTTPPPDGP
jgi:acyl-CoA thioester hydrolase